MNDLQAASAVAVGLKPLVDLAQSVLNLAGSGKGREQALELYGRIVAAHQGALAAQAAQVALVKEKQALEAELAKFEEWDREKERYELQKVGDGSFVYTVKESKSAGGPAHSICPNCYEQRQRSILQSSGTSRQTGKETLRCLRCNASIVVNHGGAGHAATFGHSSIRTL